MTADRHVAVVGAGPAGLAAAHAALAAGARVTLIDSAEQPGGQYHRMLPEAYAAEHPGELQHGWPAFEQRRRQVLTHQRCTWLPETSVWALEHPDQHGKGAERPDRARKRSVEAPPRLHLLCGGPVDGSGRTRRTLDADALVLATGAHDRVLPFPGWQLPGVYSAGAAQALAKGERVVVGDSVVVAGSGPFLLPVAASLLEAGSGVREVLEAGTPGTVARGWSGRPWELASQLGKAAELKDCAAALARHRVPYQLGCAVVEARGAGRVEEIVTARLRPDWSVVPGTERTVAVDALCVGHGFSPQLELPVAAGCALRGEQPGRGGSGEFVAVDDEQRTSVPGVFAAGEITGIAGAPAARAEGAVAGWTAAGGDPSVRPLRVLRRSRDQGRAFARRLARAHPVGAGWPGWLRPDTVVCRCEETDYRALCEAFDSAADSAPRVTKLGTRAGLGPCQARICGPTVTELRDRLADRAAAGPAERPAEGLPAATPHRRPIAQPIRLGELASPATALTDDEQHLTEGEQTRANSEQESDS
ncbi:FAD-dependent oxidoreductase [Streptomyces sp. 891-h]|uniref:FAD-dependent oxidoreductase n=1 Tax=Streptomyces sp. 891-h TaxID=2720714 RepID=UPI001FAAE4A5|nr:FAD-dependent oxidoreductase [Streptomyces sp. 891-h]UNZ19866.1 FAD-dependent oxidoreductase [Streptomyces sp. 891-h]